MISSYVEIETSNQSSHTTNLSNLSQMDDDNRDSDSGLIDATMNHKKPKGQLPLITVLQYLFQKHDRRDDGITSKILYRWIAQDLLPQNFCYNFRRDGSIESIESLTGGRNNAEMFLPEKIKYY